MEWYIRAGGLNNLEKYNCSASNKTEEEWYATGRSQPIMGSITLLYGIIVELMYVPCIMVITRPEYFKLSCYKIMTVLGCIDMVALFVNSVCTGYLLIRGAVFCTNPNLIYTMGSLGIAMWCAACLTCLILVISRIIEIWKPYLMDTLFGSKRMNMILTLPFLYGFYFFFFTPPVIFTSRMDAWFFDPFIYEGRELEYTNLPHALNNICVVAAICFLYVCFCGVLAAKFRNDYNTKISWTQKSVQGTNKIFIQSTAICISNFIAAVGYVAMNFFPIPPAFIILGHVCWQMCHGFPAFIYLSLNRTVQREVQRMLGFHLWKVQPSSERRSGTVKKTPSLAAEQAPPYVT